MATLVLAAAGSAIGSTFGGTFLGLSGAVIGRAVGATIGQVIDQRLASGGSEVVEQGRVERLHLMGASEGAPVPLVWGRMRVAGQVIWATRFVERVTRRETGGGKGGGRGASSTVEEYSYSVSLAVALCEGRVARLGRVWADGIEVDPEALPLRFYPGSETQLPDPKIAAVEGAGNAPAYRGTAYVVLEDLALAPYGNRVPQFSFEVFRHAQGPLAEAQETLAGAVRAVALLPGTGEYSLATTPVHYDQGLGSTRTANRHAPGRDTDFSVSLRQLREELPACESVSVVVSWFGNDLRLGQCEVRPKVEQTQFDGAGMPWRAGGIGRAAAALVPQVGGRPVYGGTPADAAVIEGLRDIRARGQKAMFYPFVLMEQLEGNGRSDPWTGAAHQPVLPWRGRITLSVAPGRAGSPDRTAAAAAEVAAFFGTATPADVRIEGGQVVHDGVTDWGYRRFILHYARLCQLAGGIDAFCIGSELRGITQIRGVGDSFPAVDALRQLVADVRAILGPSVKISYAADWSEYWGHAADGNRYFHLDPLWADPNVDFVGIDNYMPLSDWRSGQDHADAGRGSIYALDYLKANIAGGEGFDWYYDSVEGAAAQRRLPIVDGLADEPWIWRYKDLKSWWSKPHHERIGGVRSAVPTGWVPQSKPFWFTEYGCPAVDRGTNQPNLFLDARSSESALPRGSTGARDDLIQMQYLRAFSEHFADAANNPISFLYGGPMVDMARAHVWAWDARPFPQFPALMDVWSDGDSYRRGHWLNGRASAVPLGAVIGEIAGRAGLAEIGTERLYGLVRGYELARIATARAAIQPLSLAFGFDAAERGGRVVFTSRTGVAGAVIDPALVVADEEADLSLQRASAVERADEMRVTHVEEAGDYQARVASARSGGGGAGGVAEAELSLLLTDAEARGTAERWIAEAEIARDVARFALPPSRLDLGAGDVVRIGGQSFRIDSVELGAAQVIEAVRTETGVYALPDRPERPAGLIAARAAGPVAVRFLDLPLMTGAENPVAPHVAVAADPWNGGTAVWSSDGADGYRLVARVEVPSIIGQTESPLAAAPAGLIDRAGVLRVRLSQPEIASAPLSRVLNGANLAAIGPAGDGEWEVFQFTDAQPVGAGTWELRGLLRGQCGTDGVMPASWPAGSAFVLLDGTLPQLRLSAEEAGLVRRYRVGAAVAGPDAPEVVVADRAFAGIGQRPYPVAHLRAATEVAGTRISWIRRTRIGGDSWQGLEVPLGETREAYLLRIRQGGVVLREVETATAGFLYTTAMQVADQAGAGWRVEVAQLSDAFGTGPFRSLQIG